MSIKTLFAAARERLAKALVPSPSLIRFTGDMKRLQLQPGDVLVLSLDEYVPDDACARLRCELEKRFPGHLALVLGEGLRLGAVGRADVDAAVLSHMRRVHPDDIKRS